MISALATLVPLVTAACAAILPLGWMQPPSASASPHELAARAPRWTPSAGTICIVHYWGEARYRNYGYDHIVHLRNGCRQSLTCSVSTNVAPKPVDVRLDAAAHREVVTFLGSPARAFRARVTCRAGGDSGR